MSDAARFLESLTALGVPILTAEPGTKGEFTRPTAWQRADSAGNAARIAAHRPGHALLGVMGGRVVVVDVDTKNGADAERTRQALDALGIVVYADVLTPSGGRHYYVAGHPDVPTVHATADRDGLTGHPGVELIGPGANVFLPGTTRPKYGGAGYVILTDNLEALADGADPAAGEALAAFVAERRVRKGGAQVEPGPPWDGTPPDARQAAYLEAALTRQADELAVMGRDTGRNNALNVAAVKLGSLVAGAGLDEARVIGALTDAAARCGLTEDDGPASVAATIASGLRYGRQNPRTVPPSSTSAYVDGLTVDTTTGEVLNAPQVEHDDGDEQAEGEAASWTPVDLSVYLDGTYTPVVPTMLPRSDGVSLIYPGLTHSFHGESESGKSMLLQIEAARLVMAGERVLFVDFESDAGAVAERLFMFGATRAAILERFVYVRPEVDPRSSADELAAWGRMLGGRFALAVIDGVTDSLGMFGYSTKDNDDITAWMRVVPKNIARRTGAAVAVVDHVTKDGDSRGRFAIGGQAKMSGLTGAGYTVEVAEPLGRGLRGVIVVRVGKDRPGYVRGRSGPMRKADRTQEAARVVVDSTGHRPVVSVEPWRGHDAPEGAARDWRPTGLMERIAQALEAAREPLSFRAIDERVTGKADHKRTALRVLIESGHVTVTDGPRNAKLHALARPYAQRADPLSDLYVDPGHTQPPESTVTVSVPYTGERDTHTQPCPDTLGTHSGHGDCLACAEPLHRLDVAEGATRHAGCLEAAS